MTDETRRSQWPWTVSASLMWVFVMADVITAAWSLIAGARWDWDRFWFVGLVVSASAVGSSAGQALVRRGVIPSRAQPLGTSDADDETSRVMRTGLLPPDADPVAWRARIRRRVRVVIAIGASSTVLCTIAAVLTAAAAHLNNNDSPVLWALAVVVLLLPAPFVRLFMRTRERGQRLLVRL